MGDFCPRNASGAAVAQHWLFVAIAPNQLTSIEKSAGLPRRFVILE
jgi:hypothetical protein